MRSGFDLVAAVDRRRPPVRTASSRINSRSSELTLDEKDGTLRAATPLERPCSREAAAEYDARRFRQNLKNMRAELLADELERRGLPGAGPPVSTMRFR